MQDLAKWANESLGIRLSAGQLAALEQYERELVDWNARFNLTAIDTPEHIRVKHFLDSLTCVQVMRGTPVNRVIDVGSGAGFPGLPLKIICPEMKLTLVESVGKKANFCRHVARTLGLEGVEVLQVRAEEAGQLSKHREQYDWAVARAVAIMPVLAEYLLPLTRVGGKMLAMKGVNAPAETQTAEHSFRLLGGRLQRLVPVTLPGIADERYLVVVDKIAATPKAYPRRVGLPAQKPL
jgi:16S rRNA (guanine527-N7)-methyltransferase